jgi:hypothetical protein
VRWRVLGFLVLVAAAPAEHELRTSGPLALAEGARGAVSVTLAPAAGRTIDTAAPLSLRLTSSPDGLELGKRRLGIGDAADPRADAPRFEVPVAGPAGSYRLRVEARFWLCARKTCRPVRDQVEVPVEISASPR